MCVSGAFELHVSNLAACGRVKLQLQLVIAERKVNNQKEY